MGKTYPKKLITAGIRKITVRLSFLQRSKMTHILKLPGCAVHTSRLSRRSKAGKAKQIQPTQHRMAITAFVHSFSAEVPAQQTVVRRENFCHVTEVVIRSSAGWAAFQNRQWGIEVKSREGRRVNHEKRDKGDNAIIVFFSFARLCLLIWYPITHI